MDGRVWEARAVTEGCLTVPSMEVVVGVKGMPCSTLQGKV